MVNHGKDVKIFTCNSNPQLAAKIAANLGMELGNSNVGMFSDGEIAININEMVRGSDVFVIQSTSNPVNNNLMELLIMIDALKRASASRITAVMPYFGYARQDRKSKARDPISAKLVADLLTTAGADRILTMDLHAAQIQGFFNIPVDHLKGGRLLAEYYIEKFPVRDDVVVVSPDLGSVTRARDFAAKLDVPIAIIDSYLPFDRNSIDKVDVQIHILPPIPYEEYQGMKTTEIAQMVRSRIEKVITENEHRFNQK